MNYVLKKEWNASRDWQRLLTYWHVEKGRSGLTLQAIAFLCGRKTAEEILYETAKDRHTKFCYCPAIDAPLVRYVNSYYIYPYLSSTPLRQRLTRTEHYRSKKSHIYLKLAKTLLKKYPYPANISIRNKEGSAFFLDGRTPAVPSLIKELMLASAGIVSGTRLHIYTRHPANAQIINKEDIR